MKLKVTALKLQRRSGLVYSILKIYSSIVFQLSQVIRLFDVIFSVIRLIVDHVLPFGLFNSFYFRHVINEYITFYYCLIFCKNNVIDPVIAKIIEHPVIFSPAHSFPYLGSIGLVQRKTYLYFSLISFRASAFRGQAADSDKILTMINILYIFIVLFLISSLHRILFALQEV